MHGRMHAWPALLRGGQCSARVQQGVQAVHIYLLCVLAGAQGVCMVLLWLWPPKVLSNPLLQPLITLAPACLLTFPVCYRLPPCRAPSSQLSQFSLDSLALVRIVRFSLAQKASLSCVPASKAAPAPGIRQRLAPSAAGRPLGGEQEPVS